MPTSKDYRERAHPAGQGGPIASRYMVFLRITCLGIEKARRAKEQQNAVRRLDTIRRQLQEIEAETAALVRASRGAKVGGAAVAPARGGQ